MLSVIFLGHAGFLIENENTIIITDPWITPGAFDKAWFQYPRNEHVKKIILDKLNIKKNIYIYISHEHSDHFDPIFLKSIEGKNFSIITGDFNRKFLKNWFNNYNCREKFFLKDKEELIINKKVKITLFVDDCEMDRDSGILISMNNKVIYNGNDLKYDNISAIKKYGDVDILAQQFSGATWHPVCYKYSKFQYESITKKKRNNKKKLILRYLSILNVKMYIPSAGPPALLDPILIKHSKNNYTIFPRANWIRDILKKEAPEVFCEIFMPGDEYSIQDKIFINKSEKRVDDYNYGSYLEYLDKYQSDYLELFRKRKEENLLIEDDVIFLKLYKILEEKVKVLSEISFKNIFPMYFKLFGYEKYIRLDICKKEVSITSKIIEKHQVYILETYGWQINKVINNTITWDQFHLTFRSKLYRKPDEFQNLLNSFIFQQKEDLERTFNYIINLTSSNEKIKIKLENGKCYEICKKCPHAGQDLKVAEIEDTYMLICPKHCWKFDLENGGKCTTSNDTILAKEIIYNKSDNYVVLSKNKRKTFSLKITHKEFLNNNETNPIIKIILSCDRLIYVGKDSHFINLSINNVVRSYTFVNDLYDEKTKHFELYIKLYKKGVMSNLLKNINLGNIVNITMGKSDINMKRLLKYNVVNIIAGGTGITPFYRLIKNNNNTKFNIIYFNKSDATPIFKDFLLGSKNVNVQFLTKRLISHAIYDLVKKPYLVLISGPDAMIDYYKKCLYDNGINLDKLICYY
jgi:UDP-MurNAc hydroxylase